MQDTNERSTPDQPNTIANGRPPQRGETVIRSVLPASDWFILTVHHDENRVFIERAVAMALIQRYREVEHLTAFDCHGHPPESDAYADTFLVFGPDLSPVGETWSVVYAKLLPCRLVREIQGELARLLVT